MPFHPLQSHAKHVIKSWGSDQLKKKGLAATCHQALKEIKFQARD